MDARSFDAATNHLLHFVRIKWLANVVVRSKAKRFFRGFERTKSGEHNN